MQGCKLTRLPTHSGRRQRPIICYVDDVYYSIKNEGKWMLIIKYLPLQISTRHIAQINFLYFKEHLLEQYSRSKCFVSRIFGQNLHPTRIIFALDHLLHLPNSRKLICICAMGEERDHHSLARYAGAICRAQHNHRIKLHNIHKTKYQSDHT